MVPKPDDRFKRRADDEVFTFVSVEADGTWKLRTRHGGHDFLKPDVVARDYEAQQWTLPDGRRLEVDSRWTKNGEYFTVTRIDPPPVDRVLVRGDVGQVVGVAPIVELFAYYRPANEAELARAAAAREAAERQRQREAAP